MTPVTKEMVVHGSSANTAVVSYFNSQMAEDKSAGCRFPMELIIQIGENMGVDVKKLRLVCRGLNHYLTPMFAKYISENKKVYATPASMGSWLGLISTEWASLITNVTVVGETFCEHPHGYDWAWEHAQDQGRHFYDEADTYFINDINISHRAMAACAQQFVTSGTYRIYLTHVLCALPNLNKITIQPELTPGEHIPGWGGARLLPCVSGFRKLDLKHVFYGTWEYDTKYKTVTRYVDEYGMDAQTVQDPGPQAGFHEDLTAALEENKKAFKGEVEIVTV